MSPFITPTQAGDYFQVLLDYSGEASPDAARKESILLVGTYAGQGSGGTDAVAEVSAKAYLPPNPESYTYDVDGNLLTDSRWEYSWDGESRLAGMEPSAGAVALGLPKQKQVFSYDSEGRRFRKETFEWDSVGGDWETSPAATSIYLYDGWNLLSERIYDGSSTLQDSRYYTWGTDMSGTLQGAGGVGGLLAATTDTGSYYPAYDGNGNVMGYIDSLTGSSVAQFAYGPFGQALRATGSAVDELSFRFSTKYADTESGLVYYGYRYYDAVTGRWLNRDPIEEEGGLNLYGFVGNDGVNYYDVLGNKPCGTLWRRSIDPEDNPFISDLFTWLLTPHWFIVTADGQVLANGGDGSQRDHWSATGFIMRIPEGDLCECFTECLKREAEKSCGKGYNYFTNNCGEAKSWIRKCGGQW